MPRYGPSGPSRIFAPVQAKSMPTTFTAGNSSWIASSARGPGALDERWQRRVSVPQVGSSCCGKVTWESFAHHISSKQGPGPRGAGTQTSSPLTLCWPKTPGVPSPAA